MRAMIVYDGDWDEIELTDAERMVVDGIARRREDLDENYDDGLPTFEYSNQPEAA